MYNAARVLTCLVGVGHGFSLRTLGDNSPNNQFTESKDLLQATQRPASLQSSGRVRSQATFEPLRRLSVLLLTMSPMAMFNPSGQGLFSLPGISILGCSHRATHVRASVDEEAVLSLPVAEQDCWRPTMDDVDRISWGKPAKKKGTGSRGCPHRLNDEERGLYDIGRNKGFVEIGGSGWRRARSGWPLVNTYRSWCDARSKPAIYLFKDKEGNDDLCVDLSPLRTPLKFKEAAEFCLSIAPGGVIEAEGGTDPDHFLSLVDEFRDDPIHRLPGFTVSWTLQRSDAKVVAKHLAETFGTGERKGRRKSEGLPNIKPGKSRRHGGYGIER
mmetsp:Transcript_152883/g.292808  ORF Transcript_152883/g.292808 Transcript_152883/m.292808 type:complete len:328 (+) Transcript_152883:90-1073(+)